MLFFPESFLEQLGHFLCVFYNENVHSPTWRINVVESVTLRRQGKHCMVT
jgi:hypothetical protein